MSYNDAFGVKVTLGISTRSSRGAEKVSVRCKLSRGLIQCYRNEMLTSISPDRSSTGRRPDARMPNSRE